MAQRGIFDQFSDAMMSPLFLGGASLLSGGGMGGAMQGMQAGNQFAAQRQKMAEQQAKRQAFDQMMQGSTFGGVPPEMMRMAQAAGPDAGIDMLAKAYQTQQGYGQQERMARLNHDLALKRQQAGGGEYGKAGTIVQDPKSGSFYSVQYGARGEPRVTPLQIGGNALQPSKGVDQVGNQLVDKATGATVRDVTQNIQGAEQAKVVGRETGERQMAAPKALASIQAADAKTDLVIKTIGEARAKVSGWSTGVSGALLRNLPATQAMDLRETIKTLVANSGFEELQSMRDNSPTGGALGQVAIQELEMLQKVRTSLEQSQTMGQLIKNLDTFEAFVVGSKERRRKAFEMTYGPGNGSPMQAQPAASGGLKSGNYRYNPQTGEIEPQ